MRLLVTVGSSCLAIPAQLLLCGYEEKSPNNPETDRQNEQYLGTSAEETEIEGVIAQQESSPQGKSYAENPVPSQPRDTHKRLY